MSMAHPKTTFDQAVADAVTKGLSGIPKSLPSWLFYDETGDKLFQQIMRIPEYYPTRCEYDILQQHKDELLKHFRGRDAATFRLIELGAGDGLKTEILLKHFLQYNADFTYLPVDISANALTLLSNRLRSLWPQLRMKTLNETYDEALVSLREADEKKVILFMGANIGNFTTARAAQFLKRVALPLSGDDMLLIGFDLKKDPRIIQEAYDDARGLTARFNLNILTRLNGELGADFNPDNFSHYPCYDPVSGTMKSFLISMKDQAVYIEALDRTIPFYRWEPIHTEVSQKYDLPMIERLMALSGLQITEIFYDSQAYFCDVLVRVR
jgi:L-histidine N-alpha-methyltransferase